MQIRSFLLIHIFPNSVRMWENTDLKRLCIEKFVMCPVVKKILRYAEVLEYWKELPCLDVHLFKFSYYW